MVCKKGGKQRRCKLQKHGNPRLYLMNLMSFDKCIYLCLYCLQHLELFLLFIIQMNMQWYLFVVLICISLMNNDDEYLFMSWLFFIYLLWWYIFSHLLLIFYWVVLLFSYNNNSYSRYKSFVRFMFCE